MADSTQTTRFRFWLWLIRVIGVIVPRRLRADWRQEWEAELQCRELLLADWDKLIWKTKLDLLRRSLGAFWDAVALQPQRLEDEMFQDLRYGVRMLLKHRGFTLVAVLSLALGIGANTALFSLVDAVLLKTLPVAEPERLALFEWQAGLPFRANGMSGTSFVSEPPGTQGFSLFRYDVFGFNQENLLLFRLQPEQGGYKDERLLQFYQRLFDRLDNLPGVRAATFARVPLIAQDNWGTGILLPGETDRTAGPRPTNRQTARENYFATMEIPFLRGRDFTEHDDQHAPRVAIVSQTFERKFFPNEDVLGKRVTFPGGNRKREIEIIGVVADTKYMSQREELKPLIYTPWPQEGAAIGEMHFALRTTGEPTALTAAVREIVRDLDGNLPVTEVTSQTARSQATLGQERLYARLLSFFGGLALLLAAIGLSGVLAYSVAQRTNEIGIRMALGAQARDVLRLVVWQGMKLVLLGLVVGALSGYALKRLLASEYFGAEASQRQMAVLLYGVNGADPLTFAIIASVLTMVALVACLLPARKASQVDPLEALRQE